MDRSPQELRDEFFSILDEGATASPDQWHRVWRLFIEHPWYQEELQQAARRVVRQARASAQWAEDIEQDAMLLLGQHLRHAVDLHVNRALAQEHFAGWLGRIITRDCSKALRAMRRAQRRAGHQQATVESAPARSLPMDEIIDLSLAISKLSADCRRVLFLRLRGWGIAEISRRLRMSQTQVHRVLQRGLAQLKRGG